MSQHEHQWDLFLAHAGPDVAAAEELYDLLTPGWRVFLDSRCLLYGDDWDHELATAQRSSLITAVLISSHTEQAYYQREEIAAAIAMARKDKTKHRVVPIYLNDPQQLEGRLPYGLQLKHSLSVAAHGGLEGVAQRLRELSARLAGRKADGVPEQKRRGNALDLSRQQHKWERLEEVADDPELQLRVIHPGGATWARELDKSSVLMLPLPFHELFTREAIDEIERWVRAGGGLFLMGCYAADTHHGSNPSYLARVFGLEFNEDLVMPPGRAPEDSRRHVFGLDAELAVKVEIRDSAAHPILAGVREVAFLSACSLEVSAAPASTFVLHSPATSEVMRPEGPKSPEGWRKIIIRWRPERTEPVPLLAACAYGKGRVVVSGTWKLCTLPYGGNAKLVRNILAWLNSSEEE